jgi:Ca2+-binding RTX toxin-like protein
MAFIQGDAGDNTLTGDIDIFNNDVILGLDGDDKLFGLSGNDSIQGGNGDDLLVGGDGIDTLLGQAGNDTLYGDAGIDYLFGGDGDDGLVGGDGNDFLSGDSGKDILAGGTGVDTLVGGLGADEFAPGDAYVVPLADNFSTDFITDFSVVQGDRLLVFGLYVGVNVSHDVALVANDSLAAGSGKALVYSQGSGNLFYNKNLADPGFGVTNEKLAILFGAPALTAASFSGLN